MGQGQGIYWCGGAWGQSQGLTAQQVAQIVQTYPGPHYVWAPGMAEWTPAEQVPAVAAALRALGGATVADVPPGSADTAPPGAAGYPPSEEPEGEEGGIDRNRLFFFGLIGLLVFLLCGLGLTVIVGQVLKPEPTPAPTPVVTPAPTPKPTPPPPPPLPRVYALLDRPADWGRVPLKNSRGLFGSGEASSELLERNGTLHGASRVADKSSATAWCESAEDDGIGEWVELRLACSSRVSAAAGIGVRAGYGNQAATFRQNNRVAEADLTVRVSGWEAWHGEVVFEDVPDQQYLQLPEVIRCEAGDELVVRLRILSINEGSSYTDTCVSTMAFYPPG